MKKLIIIGGGFAGSYIAKSLENDFDTILIDSKDYFEFTPSILRSVVEPTHVKKIQVLHSHYLKRSRILIGHVDQINPKFVKFKKEKIYFDYLVIATGSRYHLPIKEQDIVLASRALNLRNHFDKLSKSNNILIVGGGPVGVELACEISDKYPKKKIILVHSKERLLDRMPKKASDYAYKYLNKRNVEIILDKKIISKNNNLFMTHDSKKISSDITFWCTGISPNHELMKNDIKTLSQNNFIKVNDYLQVNGYDNIFAAGDIVDIQEEKTAQNAKKHAKIVTQNIISLENNKDMVKYMSKKTPLVISLGKNKGILVLNQNVITGYTPSLLKRLIEKKEMLPLQFSFI